VVEFLAALSEQDPPSHILGGFFCPDGFVSSRYSRAGAEGPGVGSSRLGAANCYGSLVRRSVKHKLPSAGLRKLLARQRRAHFIF
jgi:hypothetical protein